jgi:hypothetical protein
MKQARLIVSLTKQIRTHKRTEVTPETPRPAATLRRK